jgi:hypothetical protein
VGGAERHVDDLGAVPGRVADPAVDGISEPRLLVVGGDPGFLVVQDDPDREHPGGRRHADDAARPARPAAMPGDERRDERAVQVRRVVAKRISAAGVVRPGADRAGQVGRARVHSRVQDADGHPAAPAEVPRRDELDGFQLCLLGRPDLGSLALAPGG